jgi:hypothetical protein
MFGPSVTVAEVFGYLGGGFVLASYSAFMGTVASTSSDPEVTLGMLGLLAAAGLTGLGLRLRLGDARASRAAGVVLLIALGFVSGAVASFLTNAGVEWPLLGLVVSAVAVLTATGYGWLHPSGLTQVGLLSALTALAGSALVWIEQTVFPTSVSEAGDVTTSGPDPIILVIGSATFWLLVAVGMGLMGLAEARAAERGSDPTAWSRAAITRFWAGLVAVAGLASAINQTAYVNGEYGRVLEPVIGDVALLILSAVLVERAFRRDATSYIYAAALGLIVALTDFNLSYLADSTPAALLVEGLILLGVGVGADRMRRRLGQAPQTGSGTPPEAVEPIAAEAG